MLDLLKHSAYCFKATKAAKKYIKDNNLDIPDAVKDTFEGRHSEDGLSNTPKLNLATSIYPYIREAKLQILKECTVSPMSKFILNEPEEEILDISQVVLVCESDEGKSIPVLNRFHPKFNQSEIDGSSKKRDSNTERDSTKNDDVIKDIVIPELSGKRIKGTNSNGSYVKEIDTTILGCYYANPGVIFIWIDRVFEFENEKCHNWRLLFQMVLLHELIHALLDCADRNNNGVLLNDSKERSDLEESLDNLLVLKCYENSDEQDFEYIKEFIKSQPREYRKAIDLYNQSVNLDWEDKDFVSIIRTLLNAKVQPKQDANPIQILLCAGQNYILDPGEKSNGDTEKKDNLDLDGENEYTDVEKAKDTIYEVKHLMEQNLYTPEKIKSEQQNEDFTEYQVFRIDKPFTTSCGENIILSKVIISLTFDSTLCCEVDCSFHFINTNGSGFGIMFCKLEIENQVIMKLIKSSFVVCNEPNYGKIVSDFIHCLDCYNDNEYCAEDFITHDVPLDEESN